MATDHGLLAIRVKEDKPEVIWRENTSIPEVPSPFLYKGRLFLVRNGGVATCLDAASGKVIYRASAGAPGAYLASPIAADGHVYFASSEGVVTVLAADGDQLQSSFAQRNGRGYYRDPGHCGKAIYVRTLQNLYCF